MSNLPTEEILAETLLAMEPKPKPRQKEPEETDEEFSIEFILNDTTRKSLPETF